MRFRLCVAVFMSLCMVMLGRQQNDPPALLTSEAGQQLFPSLAPDRTIAYSQRNGSDWDIYVLRHAAAPVNLTANSAADDWQAEFSSDGKWLAFRSERNGGGIYIMNPNGGAVKRLNSTGFNPTWSPDGTEIAYSSAQVVADPAFRAIRGNLAAVKVETGERRLIYAQGDAVQPKWSPHGQRIAFWGFASQGGQRDIWTVPAAGGAAVQVTNDAATDWNPVWAPDGKYLYFGSDRGGTMEVWRIAIDEATGQTEGQPHQITSNGTGLRGHIAAGFAELGTHLLFMDQKLNQTVEKISYDPATGEVGQRLRVLDAALAPSQFDVSPDGQLLAFYSALTQENLFLTRIDGTGLRQLTRDAARDRGPAWSPDGKKIAFYSDRGGSYDVWSVNPDGTGLTQITNTPGANRSGVLWSPDGSRMVYVQRRGTTWDTYMIDPSKPQAQQVIEELPAVGGPGEYFAPTSWSADGKSIAGNRVFTDRVTPGGIFVYTPAGRTFQLIVDKVAGARWLNDSRRLIYPDTTTNKIYVVDTQWPEPVELFSVVPRSLGPVRLSPDNKTIYFNTSGAESHIWEMNINPGT